MTTNRTFASSITTVNPSDADAAALESGSSNVSFSFTSNLPGWSALPGPFLVLGRIKDDPTERIRNAVSLARPKAYCYGYCRTSAAASARNGAI